MHVFSDTIGIPCAFGDVGHGLVLFLAGYSLYRYIPRYLDYGILLMEAGCASALFGVLYGSFFGIENLLPVLWLSPMRDIRRFMGIAIGFGVVLVSAGLILNMINTWRSGERARALFGAGEAGAGAHFVRGMLRLHVLPFLEQGRFDRLLWACDLNFVRGEDSFVRAQWAGRPLVWQIYRQQEGAHWPKLEAFLDLYCAGLPAPAAGALRAFWLAWNREEGVAEAWPEFLAARETLAHHAQGWAQRMACADDLAGNLMLFGTKHI